MWPNEFCFSTWTLLWSTHLFDQQCSTWIPLVKKGINNKNEIIIWTFQPSLICIQELYQEEKMVWLFRFYSISTFVGYLMPNPFSCKKTDLFQTIQFSISTQFSCKKSFLFQAIQFSQTVLIQLIQFSISIDFVYTQLNVQTVLFQTIQFSISTVSMSKTVPFQAIWFSISTLFKCQNSSILNNSV